MNSQGCCDICRPCRNRSYVSRNSSIESDGGGTRGTRGGILRQYCVGVLQYECVRLVSEGLERGTKVVRRSVKRPYNSTIFVDTRCLIQQLHLYSRRATAIPALWFSSHCVRHQCSRGGGVERLFRSTYPDFACDQGMHSG